MDVELLIFRTAATEIDKDLTNSATVPYRAYSSPVIFFTSILTACELSRDCNTTVYTVYENCDFVDENKDDACVVNFQVFSNCGMLIISTGRISL